MELSCFNSISSQVTDAMRGRHASQDWQVEQTATWKPGRAQQVCCTAAQRFATMFSANGNRDSSRNHHDCMVMVGVTAWRIATPGSDNSQAGRRPCDLMRHLAIVIPRTSAKVLAWLQDFSRSATSRCPFQTGWTLVCGLSRCMHVSWPFLVQI